MFHIVDPRNLFVRNVWIAYFIIISFSHSDTVASHINVDKYLQAEDAMIAKTKNFIFHERDRLDLLKTHLHEWKKWRDDYKNQQNQYITNLVNIFHMFKKLTRDFPKTEKAMIENSYNVTKINEDDIAPPTNDELKSVVLSLVNLQYMYDFKPEDIINGALTQVSLNGTISDETCIFIGETCWEHNHHHCAANWLNICLNMTIDQEKLYKIHKLLYQSYLFLDDKEHAYESADKSFDYEFLDVASNDVRLDLGRQLDKLYPYEYWRFESYNLCRGVYNEEIARRNFKCRYNYENSAFLKIAPLKEEQVHDDPKILIYRDVVYDSEMEILKTLAADELQTATVVGRGNRKRVAALISRISQTAFLNNKSPNLSQLTNRIIDMSELSLHYSEPWQVINYSPGGFYVVHSDAFSRDNEEAIRHVGNRLHTILFYMNDVPLGGETVFPNIKLAVAPVKGSAVAWHNLDPDDFEDLKTRHSGCPVILGEKWAFTQWIRAKDQKCLRYIYEKYDKKEKPSQQPSINDPSPMSDGTKKPSQQPSIKDPAPMSDRAKKTTSESQPEGCGCKKKSNQKSINGLISGKNF